MNIPTIDLPRIVVIGAGFAGLQVAKKIDTNQYQLVLIDKNNYHTFQPLLYQVSSAGLEPDSIAYPIRKILHKKKNTFYRLTNVEHIDTEKSIIKTAIGDIFYDQLVIATGATNNFFGNDNIALHSLPMKSLTDALNLRSKILGNFEKALNTTDLERREELMNFVIVGAGPTGVELAGALAELKNKILPNDFPDLDLRVMKIHVIEAAPRVLAPMHENSSEKAFAALRKLGVHIWTETFVTDYKDNIVTTNGDQSFRTDTLIWAAGVKGDFPEGLNAAEIGRGHRIITDDFCKAKGVDNVYILGDAGLIQSERYPQGLPMLASVAMQQGVYLAKALNRLARNKKAVPFIYNDKGSMATIGRNKAVVELKKFRFQGFFAWLVWMFVHLMLLVGFRNRVVVFVNWMWNYFRYNNGLRLIVRPYKRPTKA
ncbi:NADH dehydrogenase [Dokdonia pacifica]|uniref:NADH:ubiquinone reductase (non-electrogenic) n=1 Tax=Dokdonia pacifica TaxID=1627892 RepID=A0A239CPJ5_9FLAO|nr:NAD(P)/FAD-dependent oxidoreductase [Dokdonia pacifica]GGG38920.1 NADH dehydrogenase [Dokdonia pacifica]SNS21678.1 NADH dehydrogenase [Dokdonia pacifica]